MWCRDGADSYTVNIFDGQPNWDLWVCSKCLKPSRMVFEKATSMRAPKDATALLAVFGKDNGISEITWATSRGRLITLEYAPYPMKVGMTSGAALLQNMWMLLDSKVDRLMAEPNGVADNAIEAEERQRAKYEARGIAEALAILMQPFLADADAVVREAIKRHKARKAGTEYETTGLAETLWDPQTTWDGKPRVIPSANTPAKKRSQAVPLRTKTTKKRTLSAEELKGIRDALDSGMFDKAGVADMFKMSMDDLESALSA